VLVTAYVLTLKNLARCGAEAGYLYDTHLLPRLHQLCPPLSVFGAARIQKGDCVEQCQMLYCAYAGFVLRGDPARSRAYLTSPIAAVTNIFVGS